MRLYHLFGQGKVREFDNVSLVHVSFLGWEGSWSGGFVLNPFTAMS